MHVGLMDIAVSAALLAACYTDLSRWTIPNAFTVTLWPLGILYYVVGALAGEPTPWYTGLLGFAVAFPLHLVFWQIGLDKGGDAKMMIGIGACMGWVFMLEATAWSLLLMGPIGLVTLALTGKLPSLWRSVRWMGQSVLRRAQQLPTEPAPEQTYFPKAPVLLAAFLAARFTDWLDLV